MATKSQQIISMNTYDKEIENCISHLSRILANDKSDQNSKIGLNNFHHNHHNSSSNNSNSKEYIIKYKIVLSSIQDKITIDETNVDGIINFLILIKDNLLIFGSRISINLSHNHYHKYEIQSMDSNNGIIQLSGNSSASASASTSTSSLSSSTSTLTSTSLILTKESIKLNNIWQLLSSNCENIIIKQIINYNLDDILSVEIFYQKIFLLKRLKQDVIGGNFIDLYKHIIYERIKMHINIYNYTDLPTIIKKTIRFINIEIDLIDIYNIFDGQITYHQIIKYYLNIIKDNTINYINLLLLNSYNDKKHFLQVIHNLSELDLYFKMKGILFENTFEWNWREYLIELGINNILLHYLNSQLIQFLDNYDKSIKQYDINIKIIPLFENIFTLLDSYYTIDLDGFKNSFDVIVKVSVIDLINKSNYENLSLHQLYLILNSLLYARRKLNIYKLNIEQINNTINCILINIKKYHFTILMSITTHLDYIIIYFRKLYCTLNYWLNQYSNVLLSLFADILLSYLEHICKIYLTFNDIMIICMNIIDLLLPFADSWEELLFDNFLEINSCCWILICKMIIINAPLSLLMHSLISIENENNLTNIPNHWYHLFSNISTIIPTSTMKNAYLCSLHAIKPSSVAIIRPFLENKMQFSVKLFTHLNISNSNEESAIKLLYSILKLALLYDSQINLINFLLIPIIKRFDGWIFFDCSNIKTDKPWWFKAIVLMFDEYIYEYMDSIIPQFIFKYSINFDSLKQFYIESNLLNHFQDNQAIINECSLNILSSIHNIIQTLPLTLQSSLEEIRHQKIFKMQNEISIIFGSLTFHFIISSILKYLHNMNNFFPSLDERTFEYLKNKLSAKIIETILSPSESLDLRESINQVLNAKLNIRKSNIIISENNHLNLIGDLIKNDNEYSSIVDYLYAFLRYNQVNIKKNIEDHEHYFELDINKFEEHNQCEFDILKVYSSLKRIDITSINEEKWKKLINSVKQRLSKVSIGYLLSQRDDIMKNKNEVVRQIKEIYGL